MVMTKLENVDFDKISEIKKKLYEKYLPMLYDRYDFINDKEIVKSICYNSIIDKFSSSIDENDFIVFCDKDGNLVDENCPFDKKNSTKIKSFVDYPNYIIKTDIFFDENYYKINILKFSAFCGTGIPFLVDEFLDHNSDESSGDSSEEY
jgi:hypothetical protein